MNPDESVNEKKLRNQIRRQIAAGVLISSSSEDERRVYALSEAEKLRVLEITVEENNGRLPVYAGTGCPGTADTVPAPLRCEKIAPTPFRSSRPTSPPSPRRSSSPVPPKPSPVRSPFP